MLKVRAKTTDKKLIAGPSSAESMVDAVQEAVDVAKAAGKTLASVFVRESDGEGPGIRLRGESTSKPRKKK